MTEPRDELSLISEKLIALETEVRLTTESLGKAKRARRKARARLVAAGKAQAILQAVAASTQAQLTQHVAGVVSKALAAVFENPYQFKVDFVERRGRTECDLLFVKDGVEMDPLDSSGGGAIDVASFALRMAFWSLKPSRSCIILDEPFKFVSVDKQPDCSKMLKALSELMGIQIIMISHLPEIIGSADKVFNINNEGLQNV